jgi:ABC-type uncharacterized transport system ATPase subunit
LGSSGDATGARLRRAAFERTASIAHICRVTEPDAGPTSEAFESSLAEFEGTALVVTHDRYFVDRLAGWVVALEDGRLVRLSGG